MSKNNEHISFFLNGISDLILKNNYKIFKYTGSNLFSSEILIAKNSEAETMNQIHRVLNEAELTLDDLNNLKFNKFKYNGRGEFGTSSSFKDLMYSELYSKMDLFQKSWFIENIINLNPSLEYEKIFSNLEKNDKWIHLANYRPNNFNKGDTYKFFNYLTKIRELNPKYVFEIDCFGSFLKNYSHLLKKNEINELVCRFIRENISTDFFDAFPKIVQKQLNNNEDLFQPVDNIKILKINKSSFYNLLNFSEEKSCNLKTYNNCLTDIIAILNSKENKIKLALNNIECSTFNSKDDFAKIIIEQTNIESKINYESLIAKVIKSVGGVYENNKIELPKKISSIIDYYTLDSELKIDGSEKSKKTIKI